MYMGSTRVPFGSMGPAWASYIGMLAGGPETAFEVRAEMSYDLNASYKQPQNAVNPT